MLKPKNHDLRARRDARAARDVAIVSTFALAVTLLGAPAANAESITYGYDALGRLTSSSVSGGPAGGTTTAINYDSSDNRSSYTVTGAPVPPTSTPVVASFSFEVPDLGNSAGSYQYNPSVSGAVFAGKSGVAANGSAWSFPSAPDGDQVGFLQTNTDGGATITLNVSGLTQGQNYAVRYQAALRGGWDPSPVTVSVQGSNLGTFTPPSTNFNQVTTGSFTAASGTTQVSFAAPTSSGLTHAGIDNVTIVAGTAPAASAAPGVIPHYSFEQPSLGAGFEYRPNYYSDLYFQNGAGIAGNDSAWGFVNAPVGTQVAFFQDYNAAVSTNVSGLTIGRTYSVKFKATKRPNWPANQLYVSFQGNNLGYYTPTSDTSFQQFTTTSFTATASTGVLTIVGLTSGPTGTGVDDIQITSP